MSREEFIEMVDLYHLQNMNYECPLKAFRFGIECAYDEMMELNKEKDDENTGN